MTETITSDRGDRIGFDRRGQGPAVVFVVGAGPHRGNDPVTTRTAELAADAGVTSVVADRLGRGESVARGLIDLDRELDAIAALVQAVGGRAVLCGHSSGCAIALAAAARGLPVGGLVLWEAPLGAPGVATAAWTAELEQLLDADDLEGALLHYMKDVPTEFVDGWRASGEYDAMVAQAASLRPDAQALTWASSMPLPELVGGISVPVMALVGAEAFPGMAEAAELIADAIPNASYERVPGAHHAWEPADMATRLASFVEEAEARS